MVYDICQDTSGLMWFATYEGVSAYDGFKFMNYNGKDGLPEQKFKRIKCDEKGIIWCLPLYANDTIVYFENNVFNRVVPEDKINILTEANDFDIAYIENKPVICVGSNSGLFLFKDNIWTQINVSNSKGNNLIKRVIANKGKFYILSLEGICTLENDILDWDLGNKFKLFSNDVLASIEFENKGMPDEKLWVLSNNSLAFFEGGVFKPYLTNLHVPDFSLYANAFIKFHSKDKIFIGSSRAKYYVDRVTGKMMPLMNVNGFNSNGAYSSFIDSEENVWFVDTRGVDKFNKLSLVNYFEINGLLENEVTAITEMNDGSFVFGHISGLTILGSDNKFMRIPINPEQISSSRIHDILKDKDGNVWFTANEFGLGKLNPDGKIKWYKTNDNALFYSVQQDIKGRIWVGTAASKNKLYYLENDKLVDYKFSSDIDNTPRKLFPCDKGGLYLVGIQGFWYVDENGTRKIPSADGKKADNVYSYYKNKEGLEFVGTSNGLYAIENGQIVKYHKNGVNIKSPVYFILQDKEGNYWFGSNDGVYKWDGEYKLETFNIRNGLAGNEANRSAGIVDSKGRVWIGTDLGLTCYKPEYNHRKIPVPKIMLYDLEDSKGVQYYLEDNNSISYADNTLIFNFRGISFVNEELMVYKYKLEGYDNDWQEIKQSMLDKVKYVDVDPGEYRLIVMVKNSSGEWSEVKKSGMININSPFYKSMWFAVLILVLFGGAVGSFVKIKDQKYQNTKLEKEIRNRKRIEQDLIDSKRKYQDIVELLPEAIYETDIEGKLTYVNSHGLNLLGFTYEDFLKGVNVKDIISSDEHSRIEENRARVLGNQFINRFEYTCISNDGIKIPLSINAVPIIVDGKAVGIRGVAIDMSENKKAEASLIKYADDLEALNASKDKFFSIVAHDLKNPFQGLLGFSDFLHNDYDSLTEDEKKEYIGYIRSISRNAYNLLDNLLQWSRLQTGRFEVVQVRLNLFAELNSVIELLISNALRKRISLLNYVDKKIFIKTDSNMLNSVLQNLISNAIKFTNKNGEVRIESDISDGFVTVKIIDNGVGMSEEEMGKLFKIDQHLSSVGTMNETGTGLGLLLCKEMIELNGGKILVESDAGKGSEFSFSLPIG